MSSAPSSERPSAIPARDSNFLAQNPHLQPDGRPVDSADFELPAPTAIGFDDINPPDPAGLDTCVHCGFCLSTCPSYRVLGTEMDSPRGRIYLMDAITKERGDLKPETSAHFDSCLGCFACVTACPSGVPYDKLIGATRNQVERNVPRSLPDRLIRALTFNLFPYPDRLRKLLPPLWLYQKSGLQGAMRSSGILAKIWPQLASMESSLPAIDLEEANAQFPTVIPALGETRYRVGMLLGCVQQLFFYSVNAATARVLTANGCETIVPPEQGCCGALPAHQGQEEQAKTIARQTIDRFEAFGLEELDAVVINAAGCGHTLKEYGHILRDDPDYRDRAAAFAAKVKDVHEWLVEIGLTAELHPIADRDFSVVYQDACHLLHGQKISSPPRQLLGSIPGVTVKAPADAALCCGSAGVYSIFQPEVSRELGRQKVTNLKATGAEVIASPNPGCALQIKKHIGHVAAPSPVLERTPPVLHPIELLDRSIRHDLLADDALS
ncbi:MAG: (Fe-S)-binding protein [Geitlerinemataceae cyanobacterium]